MDPSVWTTAQKSAIVCGHTDPLGPRKAAMIKLEPITNLYLWIKTIHIIGAATLLGTGFGSAFFKLRGDRTGNIPAIAFSSNTVVLADKIFTAPAVVLQLVTGLGMV